MKKVLIHYFSGTGSAFHAVKVIQRFLEQKGFEVKLLAVRKGTEVPAEQFDFHIFAFSVLAFSAPVIFKRYIHRLKDGGKTKTAVLAVFGGSPKQALSQVKRMLVRRNYDVFLTDGAVYPINWIQVTNLQEEGEVKAVLSAGDEKAEAFAAKVIKQESTFVKTKPCSDMLFWIIAALFGLIGRRFFGKLFIADDKCTNCGLCVNACPARVIRIKGLLHKKPRWNASCENCNRCINICPQQAIQVSTLRALMHLVLNASVLVLDVICLKGIYLFLTNSLALPLAVFAEAGAFILLSLLLLWVVFVPLDAFLFFLEQIPGLSKLFNASYTKSFRRYKAPDFNPSKDG